MLRECCIFFSILACHEGQQRVLPPSFNFIDLLFYVPLFSPAELDALEADMGMETESTGVPAYLQPDKEPDLDAELSLPSAPTGHGAVPPSRQNARVIFVLHLLSRNYCMLTCLNCSRNLLYSSPFL